MHYLHAILVEFADGEYELIRDANELCIEARRMAEEVLSPFQGVVYDWYDPEGAGRWSESYPPAILGRDETERFFTLLEAFRMYPLQYAQYLLNSARAQSKEHRTPDEIARTPGCTALLPPPYPHATPEELRSERDRTERVWSGIPGPLPLLDDHYLEDAFTDLSEGKEPHDTISRALLIASGEYRQDSSFFCDASWSSRMTQETHQEVRAHPERYALVFLDLHR